MPTGPDNDGLRRLVLGGALLLGIACAPSHKPVAYAPATSITLASSSRCQGQRCRCRPLDSDDEQHEQGVPAGHKRFELRLPRSTSAVWVEVEGRGVFYKPPQDVDPLCFYLDLQPGRHRVSLHAEDRDSRVGLQLGLNVNEYGDKAGPGWYRSFRLACGHAATRCTREELEAWKQAQRALPRGVLDPCGSTMVKRVRVRGARAKRLDREYRQLTVQFELRVYAFAPHQPPDAPSCKAPPIETMHD